MIFSTNYFTDKVIIVTGASTGLGFAICCRLAMRGAQVVMFARDKKKLQVAQEKVGENAKHAPHIFAGDVSEEMQVKRCVNDTVKLYGHLDGMILNAGKSMWKKFLTLDSPQNLKEIMDINYWGVVYFCYYGIPHLKEKQGKIVVISSLQSIIGVPYHTGYAASKHALNGFMESLTLEERINVLNVIVSWIRGTELRKNSLGIDDRNTPTPHEKEDKNSMFSIRVEDCADAVIKAIPSSKKLLYLPRIVSLFPLVKFIFPYWFAKKIRATISKEV